MYEFKKDINGNVWEQNTNNAWDTRMVGTEIPSYHGANPVVSPLGSTIGHVNYTPNPAINISGMTNNNIKMDTNWQKY